MKVRLYTNRDTGAITTGIESGSVVGTLAVRRGDHLRIEQIFHDGREVVTLDAGDDGIAVIKETGAFGDAALLNSTAWTPPTAAGRGYEHEPIRIAHSQIASALESVNPGQFALELTWTDGGFWATAPAISLLVYQDYWQDDETPAEDPENPYPAPGDIPQIVAAPADSSDLTMFPGSAAPASGIYLAITPNYLCTFLGGETQWAFSPRAITSS